MSLSIAVPIMDGNVLSVSGVVPVESGKKEEREGGRRGRKRAEEEGEEGEEGRVRVRVRVVHRLGSGRWAGTLHTAEQDTRTCKHVAESQRRRQAVLRGASGSAARERVHVITYATCLCCRRWYRSGLKVMMSLRSARQHTSIPRIRAVQLGVPVCIFIVSLTIVDGVQYRTA